MVFAFFFKIKNLLTPIFNVVEVFNNNTLGFKFKIYQ